jgi:hypothetical protein
MPFMRVGEQGCAIQRKKASRMKRLERPKWTIENSQDSSDIALKKFKRSLEGEG